MERREAGRGSAPSKRRRWISIDTAPWSGKRRKGSAGEGRWTTRLTSGSRRTARERERGRATWWLWVMKAERWAELAGAWPCAAGKAEQAGAPNWATHGVGRCGKGAAGPSEQAAQCSCGQAAETGQREEEGEEGRASWARRCLSLFFSNQMFIKFYFLHFHF